MTEEVHYLNSVQAGRLLGLAPKTLARYRCTGAGPVFCRFGNRVRYRREDLEAWAETRRADRHLGLVGGCGIVGAVSAARILYAQARMAPPRPPRHETYALPCDLSVSRYHPVPARVCRGVVA